MSLLSRLVNAIRSDGRDDEVDEELRFHVEEQTDRLIADGLPPDEAARAARLRLGNAVNLRERSRDVRLVSWLDAVVRDVRFGFRMLRKDAIVTGAAIASLALAMGASVSAFALIDALMLRPLPVSDPGRLISLAYPSRTPEDQSDQREIRSFSYPIFQRLEQASAGHVPLFGVSFQGPHPFSADARESGDEKVMSQYVSGNAFAALGLAPSVGRLLVQGDDGAPGAHPVAVLSHSFWTRRFGADPAVIGRWMRVWRSQVQIVGVGPHGFTGVEPGVRTDLWMPLTMYNAEALTEAGWQWFQIMGRLRPGVEADGARAVLQPVFTNALRERARGFPGNVPRPLVQRYVETPLRVQSAANGPSQLREEFARPLWILATVVGLVLLIACSNVANLLTARAAARQREMALRVSIGAGRARLVQQLLIESGLIAIAACTLGVALAAAATPLIISMLAPADSPVYLELQASWRVLAFVGVTVVLASLAFGLAPALRASDVSPGQALKAAGGRVISRIGLLRPLVMTQVAFSLTVVFLAGLLLTSFARLSSIDTGFTRSGITLVGLDSEELRAQEKRDPNAVQPLAADLLDRVRQLPGVQAASMSAWALFSGNGWSSFVSVPGRAADFFDVYFLEVSDGFMKTMGIPLLIGRELSAYDSANPEAPNTPTPVIVNETFARRYFFGQSPLGRQFGRVVGRDAPQLQTIVGLVADAKYRDLRLAVPPTVYLPMRGINGRTLEVRSTSSAEALVPQLRVVLPRIHPSLKIGDVTEQSTLIDNTLLKERLLAVLSAFFGAVSLALAAIGLYGVLSYSVVQRRREIGIRLALGARRLGVMRAVVSDLALLICAGLFIGLASSLVLARFVRALLFEVTPYDVASLALPLATLTLAAIVAAMPPALRASRVDPIEALRDE